jgi:hypothetical protein
MKMKNLYLPLALLMLLSFSLNPLRAQSALENISTIKYGIKSKRISSYDRSGGNNDRFERIAPGEKRTLADIKGAGTIDHIWITMSPEAPRLNRSNVILRIYWDGNDYPSVESPIGPFFGQGWDETYSWASLPLAASVVKGNAMVCYFKMPFAKGARIEIENQADINIGAFYYYIDYIEQEKPAENLAYFHAWYNYQVTEAPPEGENEWGLLSSEVGKNPVGEDNYKVMETEGKGQYVGINYYVNCPTPIWYGERKIISIHRGALMKNTSTPISGMRASLMILAGWEGRTVTGSILMIPSISINRSFLPLNTVTTTT